MEALTLKEFLETVKDGLEASFPLQYWITAEIAGFRVNPNSRHCYMDLVEKDDRAVVAKTGGVIWKGRFEYVSAKFTGVTGQELKDGLKVMLLVEILFHELYGFKLNINDIDPSYTLGEFAAHRKKILAQLEKEGLLNKNRSMPFPDVPQRIAIISSPSAAGYEDFINTLSNNTYGYRYMTKLFPAYMQGEQTEKSITSALRECAGRKKEFDIIIIIRGGGDQVDLHSFDSYAIGRAIAMCPLPVITGIGHRRDETVADFTAHARMISPTAVAEFVIARTREFEERIDQAGVRFAGRLNTELLRQANSLKTIQKHLDIFTNFFMQNRKQEFVMLGENFRNCVAKKTASSEFRLGQMPVSLARASRVFIKAQLNIIERHGDRIEMMNPVNVLKRGYTLTFKNGKTVKSVEGIEKGDRIETRFHRGTVESTVNEIKKRGTQ